MVPSGIALVERLSIVNDPGPYLIGIGDVIGYEEALGVVGTQASRVTRMLEVNDDGLINFFQLGRIRAEGKTVSDLEDLIFKKVVESGGNTNFNLFIKNFKSKHVFISREGVAIFVPYVSAPMYIEQLLTTSVLSELQPTSPNVKSESIDKKITIYLGDNKYVL